MDKNKQIAEQINGITIDKEKLWTKNKVLIHLELKPNYNSLFEIGEEYSREFGNELIWQYCITDDLHAGTFILPVQEGFLSIPYNYIVAKQWELLILKDAKLLDMESLQQLIDDFKKYSSDLLGALNNMKKIVRSRGVTQKANKTAIQKAMIVGMFGGR